MPLKYVDVCVFACSKSINKRNKYTECSIECSFSVYMVKVCFVGFFCCCRGNPTSKLKYDFLSKWQSDRKWFQKERTSRLPIQLELWCKTKTARQYIKEKKRKTGWIKIGRYCCILDILYLYTYIQIHSFSYGIKYILIMVTKANQYTIYTIK